MAKRVHHLASYEIGHSNGGHVRAVLTDADGGKYVTVVTPHVALHMISDMASATLDAMSHLEREAHEDDTEDGEWDDPDE